MQRGTQRELISIVVPCYNEERNIPGLYGAIKKALADFRSRYDAEIIFVDDGSDDGSVAEIEKLAEKDAAIKLVAFSRNFGKEAATSAGIRHTKGDAILMLDADFQHPPELIPLFLEKWRGGADVVIGVRENDTRDGLARRGGAGIFYAVMKRIGETQLIPRGTDFRLISRAVADEFNRFTEHDRITRGLIDWLGFPCEYISFRAPERQGSTRPRQGFLKLTQLALSSFVSHSLFPLRVTGYLGIFVTLASGALGAFIFFEKYIFGDPWHMNFSGPATLAVIIVFLVGIILSCLGLITLYIANIHKEMANRPMYVIRKKTNL